MFASNQVNPILQSPWSRLFLKKGANSPSFFLSSSTDLSENNNGIIVI
jgi:hypothetical protein